MLGAQLANVCAMPCFARARFRGREISVALFTARAILANKFFRAICFGAAYAGLARR